MEPRCPMTSRPRGLHRLLALLATPAVVAGLSVAAPAPAAAVAPLANEIAAAQRQLQALSVQVDRAVEDYDQAQLALDAASRRAGRAQGRVATAQRTLDRRQADLGHIAAAAYRSGGTDPLTLMVSSNPADYLDRAATYDQLSRNQADVVRSVGLAAKRLAEQQQVARAAVRTATVVAAELAAARTRVERDLGAQQRVLQRLKAEQARLEAIARAKAEAARRAAAAARVARARAAAQARARAAALAAAQAAAAARSLAAATAAAQDPTPAVGSDPAAGSGGYGGYTGPASGQAAVAVQWAYRELGKPYIWAAAGPDSFDCSGLTMYVWAKAGVYLPHSSVAQFGSGPHVAQSNVAPGDLVFFGSPIHHVGIYVGGGSMIVAPHTGDVVKIQPAFRGDYVGAVRP